MSHNFDLKVPIKSELKKVLIFNLNSRLPIAEILGFLGYRQDVMPLMQSLCHATRAFICNADGMPGFVDKFIDRASAFIRQANNAK